MRDMCTGHCVRDMRVMRGVLTSEIERGVSCGFFSV